MSSVFRAISFWCLIFEGSVLPAFESVQNVGNTLLFCFCGFEQFVLEKTSIFNQKIFLRIGT